MQTSKIEKVEREINAIDLSELRDYYEVFVLINSFDTYQKEDFLEYLKEKNKSLYSAINNENIAVNSLNGLHAIYHIGLNGKDDLFSEDDKSIVISNLEAKIKLGMLYSLKDDSILPLRKLNINRLIAKTIPCNDLKNVKFKYDSVIHENKTMLVKDGNIEFSGQIDKRLIQILETDSLLNLDIKKNKYLFSIFRPLPIDSFYCDDNNATD